MKKYDHKKIEKKWQKVWEKNRTFEVKEDPNKKKYYALVEFPYPSGAGLHVGHPRSYTALDIVARKKRMEGYNVLYPMGWDAFGLPTENFAIKTGRPPEEVTAENIKTFTRQLKSLGFSFDWSREVNTTDPEYYKWTQWLFLQFFKHGLAYKKAMPINWCPKDKIGLANEEVVSGCCERCGTPVERRHKEQWMLAITKYADKLLAGLKEVDYAQQIKIQQENWIGRSEGTLVKFTVQGSGAKDELEVFTTRADTLFGATYMAIAPEHELIKRLGDKISNLAEVKKYIKEASYKSDLERGDLAKDKTGVKLEGINAINPVNKEELPIFVADYVLTGYGTGAVMAVPAHDDRDFAFAKKYHLPIRQVIAPKFVEPANPPRADKPTTRRKNVHVIVRRPSDGKILLLQWFVNLTKGRDSLHTFIIGGLEKGENLAEAAAREVREETGYRHLKFVRQLELEVHTEYFAGHKDENRYAEIQIVVFDLLDDEHDEIPAEELKKHAPVWADPDKVEKMVNVVDGPFIWNWYCGGDRAFTEDGVAVNSDFLNGLNTKEAQEKIAVWLIKNGRGKKQVQYKLRDWVFSRQRYWGEPIPLVHCAKCGWVPLPEKDLPLKLPKVKKYEPTDTGESPLSTMEKWVKTKCPQCGSPARRETDTMPNWAGSSWYFLRYTDPHNDKEFASMEKLKYWMPVDWYNGGMEHVVLHLLYSRFWNIFLHDLGLVPFSEPYKKRTAQGLILAKGGEKMSKSKGNVVNPDEIVQGFGADTLRTYIMFMGPFDQAVEWDTNGLVGVGRFLERVWGLQEKLDKKAVKNKILIAHIHQTIKKVTEDIEAMRFNTAVAKMMELVNEISKEPKLSPAHYSVFLKLLSPFAPHLCEEIWENSDFKGSISLAAWPEYDPTLARDENITLVVQVNGKVRDNLIVPAEITEEQAKKLALQSEAVQKWLEGRVPKKVIYVKGKLVSIVV